MRGIEGEMNNNNGRNLFLDAVKGFGIISVVIGHSIASIQIGNYIIKVGVFVYLYHLALFAFCAGFFINQEKINYWQYISKKIKSLYIPFLIYSMIYIFLRPILGYWGIIEANNLELSQIIISISNVLAFHGVGELLGALWYVPMLFFAIAIFGAIISATKNMSNSPIKEIARILMICGIGTIGIVAVEYQMGLWYNMQISFLMIPIVALGSYFSRFNMDKYLNVAGLIGSFLILLFVTYGDIGRIELSQNMIINRWLFYPVTFCGIYFALAFIKYISRNYLVEKTLVLLGKYSFDIMTMHFLAFKVIDYIVCTMRNEKELLSVFPHTYTDLWLVYIICGLALPICFKKIIEYFRKRIKI